MWAFRPCPRPTEPEVPGCACIYQLWRGVSRKVVWATSEAKRTSLQLKFVFLFLSPNNSSSILGVKPERREPLVCPFLPFILLQIPMQPLLPHGVVLLELLHVQGPGPALSPIHPQSPLASCLTHSEALSRVLPCICVLSAAHAQTSFLVPNKSVILICWTSPPEVSPDLQGVKNRTPCS